MSNHISDLILWHNFKDNIQIDENKKKKNKKKIMNLNELITVCKRKLNISLF